MENKEYYLVTFESNEIAETLEPLLKEKGFTLERVLETILPVRQYYLGAEPDSLEHAILYARALRGVVAVDIDKTVKKLDYSSSDSSLSSLSSDSSSSDSSSN